MTNHLLREGPLFDSGYTEEELDAIFDSLTKDADLEPFDAFACALALGVTDGDLLAVTERETVMLATPRAELDRRISAIREAMTLGASFEHALEKTVR